MYQNFLNPKMIDPTGVDKNQVLAFDKTSNNWTPKNVEDILKESSFLKGPVKFLGEGKNVYHSIMAAVTQDNRVITWGNYNTAQRPKIAGSSAPENYQTLPFFDVDNTNYLANNPSVSIVDLLFGSWQFMALLSDGTVWIMGYSRFSGMEGIDLSSYSYGFRRVLFKDGAKIRSISLTNDNTDGYESFAAVSTDNNAYFWGYNPYGLYAGGFTTNAIEPYKITTSGIKNNVKDAWVWGDENPMGGITTFDGYFWLGGYNGAGQLGQGNTDNTSTFVRAKTNENTYLQGVMTKTDPSWSWYNASIIVDGNVYMAGANAMGQLGIGNVATRDYFTKITDLNNVIKLRHGPGDSSYGHSCIALTSLGEIYTWGYNAHGAVGDGTTTNRLRPYQVCSSGATAIFFHTGFNNGHATSFIKNGQLWVSGYQAYTHPDGASTQTRHLPMHITGVVDACHICQGGASPYGDNEGMVVLTNSGNVYGQGVSHSYVLGALNQNAGAPVKLI